MPEMTNAPMMCVYGMVGVLIAAIHASPGRLQREAGGHQALTADPVGERTGDRRDEDRHRRPREDPQPGLQRRVALHRLEELREEEDRSEHPEEHEERRDVRERERAVAEERKRKHRRRRARLPPDERSDEEDTGDDRRHDAEARPAVLVAAHETPHDPEQAGADEREPTKVERGVGAVRLVEPRVRERCEHEPDRDVEPEDPVPREAADDGAADERADRDREAADAAPDAERETAPGGRNARRRGS